MQSFFDRRGTSFDTTQPGFRHIQSLIRNRTPVRLTLQGGQELEGTVQWQDTTYLAISRQGDPLVLVNRSAVAMLRGLA